MRTVYFFLLYLLLFTPPSTAQPDQDLKVLQVLNRFYVPEMESSIQMYEELLQTTCSLRFDYKEAGLELAQVGNILLLTGSGEALKPFQETQATFIVNSVEGFKKYMLEKGATVIRDIQEVPTGHNMTLRHPDGTVIEYVQFHLHDTSDD